MNLNNINIEKVVVVNTSAYHIRLSNVGNVRVSGCVMESRGVQTDGLHFDGPANDITISNCDFTTGDDSIALNCPEGYSGDISNVTVKDCTFNSFSLMRLYTTYFNSNKFHIDSVSVRNCSGKLIEAAFLIGISGNSDSNSIDHLSISDCNLTAPTVLGMAENFGNITLKNVTLNPWSSQVAKLESQSSRLCAFVRPSPLYGNITFSGARLSFEGCTIGHYGASVAAVILDNNSIIENVVFDGFAVMQFGTSTPVPSLVDIGSGSIGQLVLDSVDSSQVTGPVSANGFASVSSVSGLGVLATGWAFPDAVMADGVPYISASTGRPSIKINGVIQPYPG
jgi:hypothetical protein